MPSNKAFVALMHIRAGAKGLLRPVITMQRTFSFFLSPIQCSAKLFMSAGHLMRSLRRRSAIVTRRDVVVDVDR